MLTPQEVSGRAFSKAAFGGYNMAMVDELNEVESLLARADSFAFEQDEGEFRACVAELKSQLLVLSEMQEISIQNIL